MCQYNVMTRRIVSTVGATKVGATKDGAQSNTPNIWNIGGMSISSKIFDASVLLTLTHKKVSSCLEK